MKHSYGFVAAPGGFGTLDELFEVATLIQTGKIKNFPVVLLGVEYWSPLLEFLRESVLMSSAIGPSLTKFAPKRGYYVCFQLNNGERVFEPEWLAPQNEF